MVEQRDKNKDSLNNAASYVHLSNSVPPIAKVKKPEKNSKCEEKNCLLNQKNSERVTKKLPENF